MIGEMLNNQTREIRSNHEIFARTMVRRMWVNTFLLAIIVFVWYFVYVYFEQELPIAIEHLSLALIGTADFLIGASFALSGFCYYFDFCDTKMGYRKYLGLMGYYVGLLYGATLLYLQPERYWYGFFDNFFTADIFFGVVAMAIFTFMALISNVWAMKKLGPKNWRRGLRLGYLAYALLIIRAIVIEKDLWTAWFKTPDGLPPVRIVVTLFALSVLLLRGCMIISLYLKRKEKVVS